MIIGAHSIIYSTNAEADRVFLRDVLGLQSRRRRRRLAHFWLAARRSGGAPVEQQRCARVLPDV
mgnify:CR=1 FL=1